MAARFSAAPDPASTMPVPRGFDSTRTSPGRAPALVKTRSRMHETLHRETEDRLLASDGVAARDHAAGRDDDLGRGGQDGADGLDRHPLGERGDVERHDHPPAHGEHVAARVRGGDRAEVGRIVDERREEVGGRDEREIVAEIW